MSKINGIYAAVMSVLNNDLTLNINRTIEHAEMVIDQAAMVSLYLVAQVKLS